MICLGCLLTWPCRLKASPAAESHLWFELEQGNWPAALALIEKEPTLAKAKNRKGDLPIHQILWLGRGDFIRGFVAKHPEQLLIPGENGHYPLHLSLANQPAEVSAEIIRQKPETASQMNRAGQYPLHLAANDQYRAPIELIKKLYELCPKAIEQVDEFGYNPIERAYGSRNTKTAILLASFSPQTVAHSDLVMPELSSLLDKKPLPKVAPTDTDIFILDRLSTFEKQANVDILISTFRWPLYFAALDQYSTRTPRSDLLDDWTPSNLIRALETYAHTVNNDEKFRAFYGERASAEIFKNYEGFLAKLFAANAGSRRPRINEPNIVHVVYLFRVNVARSMGPEERDSPFRSLIIRLAEEPELAPLIEELEVIYQAQALGIIRQPALAYLQTALNP